MPIGLADLPQEQLDDLGDVLREQYEPVIYEQWRTASDERVCPECGPINWLVWKQGEGPYPPLHVNCRCGRVYHHTEYRTVSPW